MANEIKLEVYTFRIRQKGEEDYISFFDTFAEKKDITNFITGFIKYNDTLNIDEAHQKSIQFKSKTLTANSAKGIFSGIIESGDYGTESILVNRTTKKQVYTKKRDDIDIKPFYYLIWVPKIDNVAFIMLQRTGIYGINSIFTSTLRDYIISKHSSLMVDFAPFVSKQLAQTYLTNGALKQISLRRFNLPADVIEQLGLKEYDEEVLSVEIKITSKKSGFSFGDRVGKFMDNKNGKFFNIESLKNLGMDGEHEEKVKVKLGGSTRTIDLSDTLEIRPYFDIDEQVEKDLATGHPTFESINVIANQYVEDIKKEIF
jgi:hypothetical protein